MTETSFMKRAIELSAENLAHGGGPFGAVVVREGKIIGEIRNFYAEKKAFVALQNTDNVTHEQAQYLADKIAKTSKLLAKKYGDIFAEGAKAAKEKLAA